MELFKLVGSIFIDNEEANKSISKTDTQASGLTTTLSKVGKGAATVAKSVAATAVAVGTAVVGLASSSATSMDVIDKASQKMGISAEAYQEWAHAMSLSGMDISVMQTGMKTLQNQMDGYTQGTKASVEAFDRLGVSIYDSNGQMKDQTTMMEEVIYALASMEDGAERTALAVDFFGKSGTEMLPLLNSGTESIIAMRQEAHDLGLVMSDEMVKNGAVLNDTLSNIKDSFTATVTKLGGTLMPYVQKVADKIIDLMPAVQAMFDELGPLLMELFDALVPIIIDLVEMLLPTLKQLLQTLVPVIKKILPIIAPILEILLRLLEPILKLIDIVLPIVVDFLIDKLPKALVVAYHWLVQAWNDVSDFFVRLWESVTEIWNNIKGFFVGIYEGIIGILDSIKTFFVNVWNEIVNAWNRITGFFVGVATWVYDNIITPVVNVVTAMWNRIVEAYHTVIDPWIEIFKRAAVWVNENVIVPIRDFFVQLWNDLVAFFTPIVTWLYDNIIKPMGEFFTRVWEAVKAVAVAMWKAISDAAVSAWNAIKTVFSAVATWFNNNVLKPVANVFAKIWDGVKKGASSAWEGIKSVFAQVANFFGDIFSKAWQKVLGIFSTTGDFFGRLKEGIAEVFKKIVNGLITGINAVVAIPFNAINKMLEKLHDIKILGVQPFEWIKTFAVPEIPYLAKGGDITETGRAVVGEAGAELIELPRGARVTPLERNGIDQKIDEILELIRQLIGVQTGGFGVYLDSGAIVGKLAPEIDKSLGRLAVLAGRRV